jgi:hypothetical protein
MIKQVAWIGLPIPMTRITSPGPIKRRCMSIAVQSPPHDPPPALRDQKRDGSLAKSIASKFRRDTRIERLRGREIGAATIRVISTA